MSKLDRAVVRNVISGNVEFSPTAPERFANIGSLHLCRPISPNRWHVVINSGDQIMLRWDAHVALSIAAKYSSRTALREMEE